MEQINLDHNFIPKHFETSDNRPYLPTNISPETISEERLSNVSLQFTRQNTVQLEQDNLVNLFHTQTPQQINPLYPQISQVSNLQHNVNPSETATIHNTSELSKETEKHEEQTVQNTQSITITNDSNLIQVPIHNNTIEETTNQNHDITSNTTQDNNSILPTSHTNITQPSQIHKPPHQNYDPPSLPHQFVNSNNTHDSPQQGSFNTQHTNTVHFEISTSPSPPKYRLQLILQLKTTHFKMYKQV